jgi:hypothetical protein
VTTFRLRSSRGRLYVLIGEEAWLNLTSTPEPEGPRRRSMYELLDELVSKETWQVDAGATTAVLGSATALFLNIKKVLKRCSQLTRRETLFRLHQVFQKVLVAFAQRLSAKIPSLPSAVKLSDSDERMVCYIINTAEYCRETVNPLGESVAKALDKPFSDEIDMTAEEDEFSGYVRSLPPCYMIRG